MRLMLISLLLAALTGPVAAQESPPQTVPIEEWSQAKVIAMGREIFIQDSAAWLATDALLAAVSQAELAQVRGWIVDTQGADRKVRFLKVDGDDVLIGWDVIVSGRTAGTVTPVADGVLSPEERARWSARQTAMANIGSLRCSRNLNTVVADDPDSDNWLVWLLTSTDQDGVVPVGGHYRFHISADGQTVVRRDQLSNSCLDMRAPPEADPTGPQMLFATHLVSSGPVETHVFLSMQNGIPIVVAAGDRVFGVQGDQIEDITDMINAAG